MANVRAGWRGVRVVALGLALLAGAGCSAVEDLFGQKPAPVAPPQRPAARKPPARPPAARLVPVKPPAVAEPVVAEPLGPPGGAPAVAMAVPNLAGASGARVEQVLGAPGSRTASGAGERWDWRGEGCTLSLFLFPDVASGALSVLDMRAVGAPAEECARRVAGARRG
jgi:hypothetical protein